MSSNDIELRDKIGAIRIKILLEIERLEKTKNDIRTSERLGLYAFYDGLIEGLKVYDKGIEEALK
jgi:hypothetical protein